MPRIDKYIVARHVYGGGDINMPVWFHVLGQASSILLAYPWCYKWVPTFKVLIRKTLCLQLLQTTVCPKCFTFSEDLYECKKGAGKFSWLLGVCLVLLRRSLGHSLPRSYAPSYSLWIFHPAVWLAGEVSAHLCNFTRIPSSLLNLEISNILKVLFSCYRLVIITRIIFPLGTGQVTKIDWFLEKFKAVFGFAPPNP